MRWLAVVAIAPHAEAEDPERVRPSSGTVRELRKVSTEAAACGAAARVSVSGDRLGARVTPGRGFTLL